MTMETAPVGAVAAQAEIEHENQESQRESQDARASEDASKHGPLDAARQAPHADEPIVLRKKNER